VQAHEPAISVDSGRRSTPSLVLRARCIFHPRGAAKDDRPPCSRRRRGWVFNRASAALALSMVGGTAQGFFVLAGPRQWWCSARCRGPQPSSWTHWGPRRVKRRGRSFRAPGSCRVGDLVGSVPPVTPMGRRRSRQNRRPKFAIAHHRADHVHHAGHVARRPIMPIMPDISPPPKAAHAAHHAAEAAAAHHAAEAATAAFATHHGGPMVCISWGESGACPSWPSSFSSIGAHLGHHIPRHRHRHRTGPWAGGRRQRKQQQQPRAVRPITLSAPFIPLLP